MCEEMWYSLALKSSWIRSKYPKFWRLSGTEDIGPWWWRQKQSPKC